MVPVSSRFSSPTDATLVTPLWPASQGSAPTSWPGPTTGTYATKPSEPPTSASSTTRHSNPSPTPGAAAPSHHPTGNGSPWWPTVPEPDPYASTSPGQGATIYTWTSDRHAQYGTRIIPTTVREATYVLDAIFDNETSLTIQEHTTDTAGYTDLVFGLFDLTGLRFSPRIRDLADQRLWRLPTTPTDQPAASLLRHRINPHRFVDHWDTMLRTAATIRHGHLPASLLVSRLQASARQNQLTRAIQEYGRIIKTISLLRYLHDDQHRRRIHRQLNKGETLHALRRQLFFANQGQLRRKRTEDQDLQGECLTLLTNAIITWNTIYTSAAVQHIQETGTPTKDHHLAHLSPATHQHINFYGKYDFTTPTPPPQGQLRPLRTPNTPPPSR